MYFIKKNLKVAITIIITAIIVGSASVYATIKLQASEIAYNDTSLDKVLDDLYSNPATKKTCKFIDGTFGSKGNIGAKYECIVGYDSNNSDIKYNFYLLAINNDNSVSLLMEHNITEKSSKTSYTWVDAMKYIDNNNLKTLWSNVLNIDLPKAQDIANAVGNTNWRTEDNDVNGGFCFGTNSKVQASPTYCPYPSSQANYAWLFNYTRECASFGCNSEASLASTEAWCYWTRDLVKGTTSGYAWDVDRLGSLYRNSITTAVCGVRPVITVLKSNLY